MSNDIIIKDWIGNVLYEGNYKSKKVDEVLEANRCKECNGEGHLERALVVNGIAKIDSVVCKACDSSGYSGDFHVQWSDWNRNDNVYEFINY